MLLLLDTLEPITLILYPAGKVQGVTASVTSLEAPKDAKEAFRKGMRAMQKGNWEEGERHLNNAVRGYPRYAAAWSELGYLYAGRQESEKARKAFEQATAIEPRFVSPYYGLAEIAMHEHKWQEMAACTAALLKLDPYGQPGAYAYDAMAHLNLNNLAAAERSAREGIKVDPMGMVPKNRHLLGVILMRKGDYVGALEQLRKYLPTVAKGPEAELVARQIAACEEGQATHTR